MTKPKCLLKSKKRYGILKKGGILMRKILLRIIVFVMICALAVPALAAPRFTGEKIEANPEEMREKYEKHVFGVMQTIALYATDDKPAGSMRKLVLPGSLAAKAVDRFDGGWFYEHTKVWFENARSENYSGDGVTSFACDVYMDCVVQPKYDDVMVYDMAYHLEFVCPDPDLDDENKWKLTKFTNLPVEADRIDLAALNAQDEGLQVQHITGPTFKGYLLIVSDPSRVYVGSVPRPYDANKLGWQLDDFAEEYQASAVVNGGGFADPNGMGKGGKPNGIVVSEGQWLQNHTHGETFGTIIGFDENNTLICDSTTDREDAKSLGLRDAVAFSPVLIQDGVAIDNTEVRIGLSARTAIGQRADGTVLMLVVDGRQPDSYGSAMGALTEILLEYGAVTAANLDGGASTALVMYGEKVNDGTSPSRVSRYMPTAFIIK